MTNMNDVFVLKVDGEKMIVTNEKSNKGVSVSVILAPPHFLFSLNERVHFTEMPNYESHFVTHTPHDYVISLPS